ncbi:MAG: immunity 26/phosphotriesterase HocA family protein [Planctomycetaceae bacterium]|jgi:hypothetical protein|nr:immunity 26/phosphotriesterase HocA family protein [Planctomycetaceae bacterium]
MPNKRCPRIQYNEGDCFAFPLEGGGYARGIIARMNGKGKILAYYFLPRFDTLEKVVFENDLQAINAFYVGFSGDPGLRYQSWSVIGRVQPWDRKNWPMPVFGLVNTLSINGKEFTTSQFRCYDEKTLQWVKTETVSVELASKLPRDGSAQNGWIESVMSKIITDIENGICPRSSYYRPLDFMFQVIKELSLSNIFETPEKQKTFL